MLKIFTLVIFLLVLLPFAFASVETEFLNLLNEERLSLGKSELYINSELSNAAYLHSKDMAENNYLSHTSRDGTLFSNRIVNAGYSNYISLAENIAYHSGSVDAKKVFQMWKQSAGHYKNMISDKNEIGLGVYSLGNKVYYTLDMGKQRNFIPPVELGNSNFDGLPKIPETVPETNNVALNLDVISSVSKSGSYYTYKFEVKASNPSTVKYKFNSRERTLCKNCLNKVLYIKTRLNLFQVEFNAKDKAGNLASEIVDF